MACRFTLPPAIPQWANDDDDGNLDVDDDAAVKARVRQVSEASVLTSPDSQAQVMRRPQPLPAVLVPASNLEPEAQSSECWTGSLVLRPAPSSTTLQVSAKQCGPKRGRQDEQTNPQSQEDTSTPGSSILRTTEHGVPLLASDSALATSRGMNPEVWNAFAANVSSTAVPGAARIFQLLQEEEPSRKDAYALPKKKRRA